MIQLGKAPIASFSNPGDLARTCKNLYPQERDSLLREFPWNCVTARDVLAPMADAPKFGFSAAFQLPANFLRLLAVGDHEVDSSYCMRFKVEGNKILAAGTSLKIEYIYRAPEHMWDGKLVELMTARMLWKMAYPLTQSTSLRDTLASEYEKMARVARNIDSQENPSPKFGDGSPLLTGRQ